MSESRIAAILILIAMTPLGLMAAAPLENRCAQPAADMPPPFGIIVLGGAVNGLVSKARGEIVFDEGERMIEAAFLAKRYPQARVVFTGGSGSLIARELLVELGVDPDRIIVEDKSRNTEENARFTAAIVHPEPKQRWLLITSAFHMPRFHKPGAMGNGSMLTAAPQKERGTFLTLRRFDLGGLPCFGLLVWICLEE